MQQRFFKSTLFSTNLIQWLLVKRSNMKSHLLWWYTKKIRITLLTVLNFYIRPQPNVYFTRFEFSGHNISNYEKLNETLYKWINAERFPTFPKVTYGNINQLFLTNKNLVLAVVEENQLEEIPPDQIDFKIMVESVMRKKRAKYHE